MRRNYRLRSADREFFYGVNFEFSYAMPQFFDTQRNMEIRPIVGWRKYGYEFIVNPIVDIGFGQNGEAAETVKAASKIVASRPILKSTTA